LKRYLIKVGHNEYMKTVIMAGGYATRLLPLTETRSKPLLPVAGKPIINYMIEKIPQNEIIVTTNEKFRAAFEQWQRTVDKDIDLVIEQTEKEEEKLGTIGAIAHVISERAIDEDLFIIGGDNILELDFHAFLASSRGTPLIALYDVGDKEKVKEKYGVVLLDGTTVTGFQEKPKIPKSTLVSVACYLYPRDVLPLFSRFLNEADASQDAPGYFNEWLSRRREMHGFVFHGNWYDIGDRKSYIEAHMNYSTEKSTNAEIVNSTVEDSVILENTRIINSSIRGCVIDRNSLLEGVTLENCIVGEGTKIRKT
jgi:glucose-1-phosphate thymidylyltransferase